MAEICQIVIFGVFLSCPSDYTIQGGVKNWLQFKKLSSVFVLVHLLGMSN
jgi:hypothetical protein